MTGSTSSDRRGRRAAKRREQRAVIAAAKAEDIVNDETESLVVKDVSLLAQDGGLAASIMRVATPFRRRGSVAVSAEQKERWADVAMDACVSLIADAPSATDVLLTDDALATEQQPATSQQLELTAVLSLMPPSPVFSPPVSSPPVSPPLVYSPPVASPPVSSPRVASPPVFLPPLSSPPVSSPQLSSQKLAPWEVPADGAAFADCSYRNKLRAGGQQAFQRALVQGMLPKASQSHLQEAGSRRRPTTAPVMLPSGALTHSTNCVSGVSSPMSYVTPVVGGMMHPQGCQTSQSRYLAPPRYHATSQYSEYVAPWTQHFATPCSAPPTSQVMAPTFALPCGDQSPPVHDAFEVNRCSLHTDALRHTGGFSNQQVAVALQASIENEVYED